MVFIGHFVIANGSVLGNVFYLNIQKMHRKAKSQMKHDYAFSLKFFSKAELQFTVNETLHIFSLTTHLNKDHTSWTLILVPTVYSL